MNELAKILATIRRPFQQEIRNGCQDNVVIDGLGPYVQLWVRNAQRLGVNPDEKQRLESLADLFSEYGVLSSAERRNVVQAAMSQIDEMTSENRTASPPRTSAATDTVGKLPLFQSVPSQSSKIPTPLVKPAGKSGNQQTLLPVDSKTRSASEPIESSPSCFTVGPDSSASRVPHSDSQTAPPEEVHLKDIPISTDPASLKFLETEIQYAS